MSRHAQAYACVYVCVSLCVHIFCLRAHVCACARVHTCITANICICTWFYICTYVYYCRYSSECVYIYISIYTHICSCSTRSHMHLQCRSWFGVSSQVPVNKALIMEAGEPASWWMKETPGGVSSLQCCSLCMLLHFCTKLVSQIIPFSDYS